MSRIVLLFALLILAVGGVFVLGQRRGGFFGEVAKRDQGSMFTVGKPAPDFTLKDFSGNDVSLSSFYGKKAVVLDFWAAWCPFCVSEMPELQRAQEAYKDKLVMIGVHRTDSGESIATGKKFADERGVTYLLLQGTNEIYKAATKGIQAMPVAVYIDTNGVVQEVKSGPKTESEIKEKVNKLVQ